MTVLIVDDNDAYRAGLAEYLGHVRGLELVGEAGGGQQAIYLTRTLQPDLVLMDISMPGTNGVEAAREIKESSSRTKVVFLTIHKEETYRAVGEMLGIDGFVSKDRVKKGLQEVLGKLQKKQFD
ncbi:MAG: response regulator transcription factor [Ignavibacteriales bacterium]|nr:response regulator transcription factor [Ignavibacteriales bacterium]